MTDDHLPEAEPLAPPDDEAPRKSLTIGAVCKALSQEFPDISISKIRYLEDQKLLTPRRTQGGYRLYAQTDVTRLRTILRLQRDEFLPLRVIRQELAAGRADDERPAPAADAAPETARPGAALRRLTFSIRDRAPVLARGRAWRRPAPTRGSSTSSRTSASSRASCAPARATTTRPSARSCARSPSSRATASPAATCACSRRQPSARRALLQQILAPSLRSRNPERRKEAIEALENLAAVASHLKHLLLVRDLRRIAK